jgi:hypothetical protein
MNGFLTLQIDKNRTPPAIQRFFVSKRSFRKERTNLLQEAYATNRSKAHIGRQALGTIANICKRVGLSLFG